MGNKEKQLSKQCGQFVQHHPKVFKPKIAKIDRKTAGLVKEGMDAQRNVELFSMLSVFELFHNKNIMKEKELKNIYNKILTANVGFQVILYFALRGCLYFPIFLK